MVLTLQGARGSLRNIISQRQDEEHWAKYEMVIQGLKDQKPGSWPRW